METRWSDQEAERYRDRYAARWGENLALRVYTSRLIGADPELVLHGGGNTSLKGSTTTLLGDGVETLWVKGSGSDLDRIEPPGFPALDLAHLRRLRQLETLSDEEMVNQLRTHLFQASAPNPSVETLLHANLPHAWVDHTHANAIVALTNQAEGDRHVREALGPRVGIVPYVMPGFSLSRSAADVFEADPTVDALVLMNHGLFTFGQDARSSYEGTIRYVDLAERYLRGRASRPVVVDLAPGAVEQARARWPDLAPLIRGALARPADGDQPWQRVLLDFRSDGELLALLAEPEAERLAGEGPLTPDHTLRTKSYPLYLDASRPEATDDFRERFRAAVDAYRTAYDAYFDRQEARSGRTLARLQGDPPTLLLPGLGVVGVGATTRDAAAAADIAVHNVRVKAAADRVGRYRGLSEADLFDVEYWSLEQAKLGRASQAPLAGQVALVTGGAGAVGLGIARRLVAAGAHVALADLNETALGRVREQLQVGEDRLLTLGADVTDERSVREMVRAVCARFGGLDLCVPNAGIAHSGPLLDTPDEDWRRVIEVNATGYFLTIREAARVLVSQGLGGNIVINASKNVFAPGAEFAPYSASKAAGHQLGKVAALELAKHGIRVNMVNADAIFGDAALPSGLWQKVGPARARARGLQPDELQAYYRQRNLLKAEVRAEHVGNAVVFFASNQTPTTGATLPIDGGIPEAFPR
jgi:rhamnulose-1-phosphate aldolase/alcohol dehydrogenase